MNNYDHILRVGRVKSVQGRRINILVDKRKNSSHIFLNGDVLKNIGVGSYIKIAKGFSEVIGKIEGESLEDDQSIKRKEYFHSSDNIKRELIVTLVGFIENNKFYQGIKELPLIDNECYLLQRTEFDVIHKFIKDGEENDAIRIGVLANETGVPIELGIDNLFASHIGIFGNTGSGKSYTLAKLYHELLKKYKSNVNFKENAKFILIDFNGEYVDPKPNEGDGAPDIIVESDFKSEYRLSTDFRSSENSFNKFPISKSILGDLNFWTILLKATEQTQRPFIHNALNNNYLENNLQSEDGIRSILKKNIKSFLTEGKFNQDDKLHISYLDDINNADEGRSIKGLDDLKRFYLKNLKSFITNRAITNTNINSSLSSNDQVDQFIEENIDKKIDELVSVSIDNIDDLTLVHLKLTLNYYHSVYNGFVIKEHISPLMGRLSSKIKEISKVFEFSTSKTDSNLLTVISLKDVNVEMKKVIPLIVVKEFYEKHKKENVERKKYLNIIVDEAHNILSSTSNRESETWKDYRLETFEEIIKEGRKFGVFLTIASQRPFDISTTIISQLHNYFLHRLINNKDIEAIEKTVSYLDKISFESIPILPQGTCVLAGLAAQLPILVKIDELKEKDGVKYTPYNETIKLSKHWK